MLGYPDDEVSIVVDGGLIRFFFVLLIELTVSNITDTMWLTSFYQLLELVSKYE